MIFNLGDPLTQVITVLINGDIDIETNETFSVHLVQASNATLLGGNSAVTATIIDDDLSDIDGLPATGYPVKLRW